MRKLTELESPQVLTASPELVFATGGNLKVAYYSASPPTKDFTNCKQAGFKDLKMAASQPTKCQSRLRCSR